MLAVCVDGFSWRCERGRRESIGGVVEGGKGRIGKWFESSLGVEAVECWKVKSEV